MLIEVMCAWTFCTVSNKQFVGCTKVSNGTTEALAAAAKTMTNSGLMLTAECWQNGGGPEVDWETKGGSYPFNFKKK